MTKFQTRKTPVKENSLVQAITVVYVVHKYQIFKSVDVYVQLAVGNDHRHVELEKGRDLQTHQSLSQMYPNHLP